MTESTQRLCEGYFTFQTLGPTRVKGVSEPINVHEVFKDEWLSKLENFSRPPFVTQSAGAQGLRKGRNLLVSPDRQHPTIRS